MVITPEMLAPITTTFETNTAVITPVGIGIMAGLIGIALIPKVLYKFI